MRQEACFHWNCATCQGTELHRVALTDSEESLETARAILDEDPSALEARFWYHEAHKGVMLKKTGQAIHLAASKGNIEMLKLLVERGASLGAYTTRGGINYYNVFMAAVFAEGRSDNYAMVRYLIEANAPVEPNCDGQWPLHWAYRLGNVRLIPLLQDSMDNVQQENMDTPPLLEGIRMGKLTTTQLAWCAPATPASLRLFLQHEPMCIPEFLAHVLAEEDVHAVDMAAMLSGSDLAGVIRRHPAAACALFDAVIGTPVCQHEGWHPLPSRASFAPTTRLQKLRRIFNPTTQVLVNYEYDNEWKFDKKCFKAPEWHSNIPAVTKGPVVHDVSIKVCYVPDILCGEYFAALTASGRSCTSLLFEHPLVIGSIEYMWWQGAFRSDLLQVLWSLWAVVLWIVELWLITQDCTSQIAGATEQETAFTNWTLSANASSPTTALFTERVPTTAAHIGTMGFATLLHEVATLVGLLQLGCGVEVLHYSRLYQLVRSAIQAIFMFKTQHRVIQQLMILFSWASLLELFASAETLAISMLPLKNLGWSLGPPILITAVCFSCCAHLLHNLQSSISWRETFFSCFALLITAKLPEQPQRLGALGVAFNCLAILIFSVFLMNIFIGILGTQYQLEKTKVNRTFQHLRAERCRNFLARARTLPCGLCSERLAAALGLLAVILSMGMQIASLTGSSFNANSGLFVFILCGCKFVPLLAGYQSPSAFWAKRTGSHNRFLWLTIPCSYDGIGQGTETQEAELEDAAEAKAFFTERPRKSSWGPRLHRAASY